MFKLLDGMKKRLFLRSQNRDKFFEKKCSADIAQLVEQLICNQPVVGSSPSIGSSAPRNTKWESSRAVKWDRL